MNLQLLEIWDQNKWNNNESTAARDMGPKQMEYSSLFLLIRIFDEPSFILDIP